MRQIALRGMCAVLPWFGMMMPLTVGATNGMNMDAWGAKSGGMGGASFAYDSGNSAVMNNPATLGLRAHEKSEIGLGLTLLMPDVASSHPQAGREASAGNLYTMPTLSWSQRRGAWTYGAAMLAQGGMGTEYGKRSALFAGGTSLNGTPGPMSGEEIRSEVGVGRIMFPFAFRATDSLILAAQLDFVWATMDVQMDVDGRTLGQLAAGTPGAGRASGSLMPMLAGFSNLHYARFDFSDNQMFSGAAKGTGWAGKLGVHYQLSDVVALGATWHSKTALQDLRAGHATLQMGGISSGVPVTMPLSGKIKVLDFQWPETYGVGLAWQVSPQWLIAGDIKHIRWSDSMRNFSLKFEADQGGDMTAVMEQNWKDQTVMMLGAQYLVTPEIALRAGVNYAKSPVPDATLNPLFPATITHHYTLGFGWRLSSDSTLAASLAYAPKVSDTNPGNSITSSHRQTTMRVNYNFSY